MCSVSSAVGSRPGTVSAGIAAQQAIKNDKNSSTTKGVTQDNARNTDTISRTTAPANQTAETQTQAKSVVSNVAKEEVTDPSKSTKSGGMKDSYNASPQLQQQLAAGVQGSQSNTPAKVTADIVKGLQKDEGNKQKQGDEPIEGFTRSESMKNNKAKPDGVGRRRR